MKPEVASVSPDLTPPASAEATSSVAETAVIAPPKGSYVKHAMRNMVRKRGKSLQHFFLSTVGMLVLFIGLAYITR